MAIPSGPMDVFTMICASSSTGAGCIVDIINWQENHAAYIADLIPFYDLFMTALDGVRTLTAVYGVSYDRVIALSHHELDIRMLIEKKGVEVFDRLAN